jgi:hypothetical protein
VSYSNPHPLLFIGLNTGVRTPTSTLGMDSRANQETPHGRRGLAATRSVRPTCGVVRPLWAPLPLCFLVVAVRWVLKAVPGVHAVWAHVWAIESM